VWSAHTTDGFSAIELLTGVAIMGMVVAMALPNWSGWVSHYSLNNSTRQVQSELHEIKMRAAAENIGYQLAYLQSANAYTIQRDGKTLVSDLDKAKLEGAPRFNRANLRELANPAKAASPQPTEEQSGRGKGSET